MNRFVYLIHGARRIHRAAPNRAWMDHFAGFLLDREITRVSCFSWSGGLIEGFSATDAATYAEELRRDYERLRAAGGGSLSIVAKSLGGLIAERALLRLQDEIQVDLFLRIAVPDTRNGVGLPNVSRTVNVTSSHDRLHGAGNVAAWFLLGSPDPRDATKPWEIRLAELSHFALTEPTPLKGSGSTTYDLYLRLIEGGGRSES